MNTLARVGILSLTVLLAGCTVTRLRGSPEASGVVTRSGMPIADVPICMLTMNVKWACAKTDAGGIACTSMTYAFADNPMCAKTDDMGRFHVPDKYDTVVMVPFAVEDTIRTSINLLKLGSKPMELELWHEERDWNARSSVSLICDLDKPEKYGGYCKEE